MTPPDAPDAPTVEQIRAWIALAEHPTNWSEWPMLARTAVPRLGRALLVLQEKHEQMTRALGEEIARRDTMIRELRTVLGLFTGALPSSPEQVWKETLEAVRERGRALLQGHAIAEAALMFYSAGPWDAEKRARWTELTGAEEATTRVLGDLCRAFLASGPPPEPKRERQ